MTTPDRSEQVGEAFAALQKALEALPMTLQYSMAESYIKQLRKILDGLEVKSVAGDYTLLAIHGTCLDAMEAQVKQHRTVWERERDGR